MASPPSTPPGISIDLGAASSVGTPLSAGTPLTPGTPGSGTRRPKPSREYYHARTDNAKMQVHTEGLQEQQAELCRLVKAGVVSLSKAGALLDAMAAAGEPGGGVASLATDAPSAGGGAVPAGALRDASTKCTSLLAGTYSLFEWVSSVAREADMVHCIDCLAGATGNVPRDSTVSWNEQPQPPDSGLYSGPSMAQVVPDPGLHAATLPA
eukprot:gene4290-781_t